MTLALHVNLQYPVPEQAKWLSEKEKQFLQGRLPANAPRSDESHFKVGEIVSALKDSRMWLFTIVWATLTVGTSGLAFYQPTVIANLGFTYIFQNPIVKSPKC